jgi:hypothetical protein
VATVLAHYAALAAASTGHGIYLIRGVDAFRIFALPLALVGRHLPVLSTFTYVESLEYGNPHTSAASSTLLLVMILTLQRHLYLT